MILLSKAIKFKRREKKMATKKLEIYKCKICGNTTQILFSGVGDLVCCNEPMEHLTPQKEESDLGEKHLPKFEFEDNKKFVSVIGHPMAEEHYIQFIEAYTKDKNELHLKYFYPNQTPKLDISHMQDDLEAIELCNIHGLWGGQNND